MKEVVCFSCLRRVTVKSVCKLSRDRRKPSSSSPQKEGTSPAVRGMWLQCETGAHRGVHDEDVEDDDESEEVAGEWGCERWGNGWWVLSFYGVWAHLRVDEPGFSSFLGIHGQLEPLRKNTRGGKSKTKSGNFRRGLGPQEEKIYYRKEIFFFICVLSGNFKKFEKKKASLVLYSKAMLHAIYHINCGIDVCIRIVFPVCWGSTSRTLSLMVPSPSWSKAWNAPVGRRERVGEMSHGPCLEELGEKTQHNRPDKRINVVVFFLVSG